MVQAFLVLSCVTTCLIYNACNNVCSCSTAVRRLQRAFITVYSRNSPPKQGDCLCTFSGGAKGGREQGPARDCPSIEVCLEPGSLVGKLDQ